jgi:hypothetical protein
MQPFTNETMKIKNKNKKEDKNWKKKNESLRMWKKC